MFLKNVYSNFLIISMHYQCVISSKESFIDVTTKVFSSSFGFKGATAAYGDINNDKFTDVFIISNQYNVTILYGSDHDVINFSHQATIAFPSAVQNVASGDFNGDGFADLMVTSSSISGVTVHICWGTSNGLSLNKNLTINTPLFKQPLLMDANGDMITDLFVEHANGTREFWIGHVGTNPNWSFHICEFKTSEPITVASVKDHNFADAFLDLIGNGFANLVLVSRIKNNISFEIWKGSHDGLVLLENRMFLFEKASGQIGQSVFIDIDADGYLDHIVPVCYLENGRCKDSMIYAYKNDKWIAVYKSKGDWNFHLSLKSDGTYQAVSLTAGDYNQDTNVDLLCVMENTPSSAKPQAVLLYGSNCKEQFCKEIGKMYEFGFSISTSANAVLASFFDLGNDGVLDILISVKDTQHVLQRSMAANNIFTRAYKNSVAADVSFLVVKVLPGLNSNSGSNVYGACVSYVTTNTAGGDMHMASCQLTQSSHSALQLPYIQFGLGRLPNFIDKLSVTVPSPLLNCEKSPDFSLRRHSWTMIIPNSLLFIKPYPVDEPTSWSNRMLIRPSKNVVVVGVVLLASCFLVAVGIVILHCMERRDDLKEKINDAHRFHFDAM